MAITRTGMIDDDGSGTTGTILNNSWKQELYNQIDASLLGGSGITANVVNTTATGTVDNLACGPASLHTVIIWAGSADLTVTGLAFSTPPRDGDLVIIQARTNRVVSLAHNAAGSTVKFFNAASSAPTPIANFGTASYVFHTGYWVLTHHEQGLWITPAFVASDYGGGWAAMTAGQVTEAKYRLVGRTLYWSLAVTATTITASTLTRKLWGNFTLPTTVCGLATNFTDSAGAGVGLAQHIAPGIVFYKTNAGASFPAGTLTLRATGFVEVT